MKESEAMSKGPSNNKCSFLSGAIFDQGKAGGEALAGTIAPTTNDVLVKNRLIKMSSYCLTGPKALKKRGFYFTN